MDTMSCYRQSWIFLLVLSVCLYQVTPENVVPVQDTQSVTLPCVGHTPNTEGKTVTWFKGNEVVSIDRTVLKFRSSLQILPPPPPYDWNLKIVRVTKDFEDVYTCKVKGIPHYVVRVVVESAPAIDADALPQSYIVPEYTDVKFNCSVTGSPTPTISWSRKSRVPGEGMKDLGIHTGTLTIVNATRYADDIYVCLAENTYDSVQREVSLRILFPPEVLLFAPDVEANKGEEVKMACIVQSSPLQDAFWRNEDGERLNSNFKYIIEVEEEPVYNVFRYLTLTLRKDAWEKEDYGQYSCNGSNGTVTSVRQFTLKRPTVTYDVDDKVIKYN